MEQQSARVATEPLHPARTACCQLATRGRDRHAVLAPPGSQNAPFQAGIEQKNAEQQAWAETYFRAAIDEGERAGVRSQTLGDAYYELGNLCRKAARFDEAESMFGRTAELWQVSLPLGNDKRFELEIARALVRDTRGMDRDGAKKIAWIARVLHAARPERRQELESQFPELRAAFARYESYCRANKLQGCQQDLSEYRTR